jgi:hypothetical protein
MPQEKEGNRNTIIDAMIAKEPRLKDARDVLVDLTQLTITAMGDGDKHVHTHYTNIRCEGWILTNFVAG